MRKRLLDSDTLSDVRSGRFPSSNRRPHEYFAHFAKHHISVITAFEIERGLLMVGALDRLARVRIDLQWFEVMPLTLAVAELAADIDAALMKSGQPIGAADVFIAATALSEGWGLATSNTRHFSRIADLGFPLELEDWRA
jgi:tRNA(fMet)-specific endonuclease VapC